MGVSRAGILGTGSAVPNNILTNQDLERMVDTSDEWIVTRTGIHERRIAAAGEATSDYAYLASVKAIEAAGLTAADIDLILCATITPDMIFPATACLIQDRLGATNAAAFDLSAACTGFIYGMATAKAFIESGTYRHVLVIAADLLSRITDFEDRATCVLFGDGAGAVVMGPVAPDKGVLAVDLGADGSGKKNLYIPAGGSRTPTSSETVARHEHFIRMEGRDTFRFAVKAMGSSIARALSTANLTYADIDVLVPHQANIRIIHAACERIGLPDDKVVVTIHKYGNTSASSIPIALDEAVREGRIQPGDLCVVVGFGGGLTWGAAAMRM